ncbi:hypothetical protein AVEN_109511-1 [Araneus ventricosus]|uniref:Prefoldin subunit 2 n=1 Tax=Araneus ventricosus TaxID=182803 RepID=A0A4Y2G3S6_ARAVE|nr:hypothetical protein AVEN_109511-1 [Araneus ventricosus]
MSSDNRNYSRQEVKKKFELLRQTQRQLYAEMANAEVQLSDYREVLWALKNSDPAAKCFYSQPGVLVQRTVEEIFPIVVLDKEKLENEIEKLRLRIEEKSREVEQFRATFNIQFLSEEQSQAI